MSSEFESTNDLIVHLRNGDENAYIHLIKTHHKMLLSYATSLTNDYSKAQDVVQNVYLDIWKDRKKLKNTISLKSYMHKATYYKFINQYHKNRALSSLERIYIDTLDQTLDDSNAKLLNHKMNLVAEGISKLPKKCKETFLLSKKEGLTNIEIAEHLNISIKTVEGHLTKAYNLLRKQIGSKLKQLLLLIFNNMKKV
ncbi:RNA polymerase sigma factor [Maribacter sp. 2304DJ31-5]|uniref:RNA polymerase sigma factor n=1 Tax=Maribacter sp. 2304DJ31-5 TaxID=3386273 RepID=UPI0039BC938F